MLKQLDNLSDDNLEILLEIISRFMMPSDDLKNTDDEKELVAAGMLSEFANPTLREQEKEAWMDAFFFKLGNVSPAIGLSAFYEMEKSAKIMKDYIKSWRKRKKRIKTYQPSYFILSKI